MATPRILVVEDEVIVARTIAGQLKQLGYSVTDMVSSGSAAIAKVAETQPDLILMDIVLKGEIDGITAATQIREQRDIPIIYLTAYADDSTLQRAKQTQPFGYVVKPFTANELRVAIEIGLFKHQVAQELQENRDRLATLLHSMGDGVIATNAQGHVTFMNPVAETLTGWSQADGLGQEISRVFQLIDDVTELPAENPVSRALREHQVVHLDAFKTLITRTGELIPIGDSASPLRGSTGDVTGAVVVFQDMRDRRQAEILAQALEKERELNRLKSQFVSTVSHEFRNPLAIILVATELLERGQNLSVNKQDSYIQRIKKAVHSMNQLMEDVLVIGQAEANRLICKPTQLNLKEFCQNLIEEFPMIEGGPPRILFHSQGDLNLVQMDERLLRYILTNLLSNALKYSPVDTTVQFNLTIDTGAKIATFQIQDQGMGIPESDQPRLFDSFFRASNANAVQGTGLGLAIVKRCVDAHSGHIYVSSQVGVGTTVTVVLPFSSC